METVFVFFKLPLMEFDNFNVDFRIHTFLSTGFPEFQNDISEIGNCHVNKQINNFSEQKTINFNKTLQYMLKIASVGIDTVVVFLTMMVVSTVLHCLPQIFFYNTE